MHNIGKTILVINIPTKKGFTRNHQGNRNGMQTSVNGGPSTPRYCIFCETNGHDTGFCKIAKYTADYKTQQCQKHNACYMCFKTSEHKANTCPKIIKCLLCPRMHHFNNHSRQEINEYYNKKKRKQAKQWQQENSSSAIFIPHLQEINTYYCSSNISPYHHNNIEHVNSHLFTLRTTINGHIVKILVDPGGDRNIISSCYWIKLKVSIKDPYH